MHDVDAALNAVRSRIAGLEARYGREPGSVALLAVSKTKPPEAVRAAIAAGQHAFGENHLQDAMTKVEALDGLGASWHFIGAVQSNKTRPIAACFDWVHAIGREKIAVRLSDQRPAGRGPLDVCIQVNVSGEHTKSGVAACEVEPLARVVRELPGLRLRGLMALPRPSSGPRDPAHPVSPAARDSRRPERQGFRTRYAVDGNDRRPRGGSGGRSHGRAHRDGDFRSALSGAGAGSHPERGSGRRFLAVRLDPSGPRALDMTFRARTRLAVVHGCLIMLCADRLFLEGGRNE